MGKEKYLATIVPGLISLLLVTYGLGVLFFLRADVNIIELCRVNRCLFTRTLVTLFDRSLANQIIGNLCIYFGVLLACLTVRKLIKKPIHKDIPPS